MHHGIPSISPDHTWRKPYLRDVAGRGVSTAGTNLVNHWYKTRD